MKKILILSCLFLFFVSSCSNQEEVIVGDGLDYDNMSEEDLRKCAEANGAITWNQFIELMGEFMESEQSPLIETKATSETFSVTGYDNTFLVEENKKVLLAGFGWYDSFLSAPINFSIRLRLIPSIVLPSEPAVIFPGLLCILL